MYKNVLSSNYPILSLGLTFRLRNHFSSHHSRNKITLHIFYFYITLPWFGKRELKGHKEQSRLQYRQLKEILK